GEHHDFPCNDSVNHSLLKRFQIILSPLFLVYQTGLSRETTDEQFQEAFYPFGRIVEAKVVRDRATGRSKGFGFVTYTSIEEAEKAREEMNAKFLHGWVIFVDPAKPREYRPPPQRPESGPSETGFRTNKTVGWCGYNST
ncbi:hypothetical protein Golob_022356, partial [Gossypium lobatum]|nr:hypothetical protein [Gossypium lobatum]